jgi:hypothetical protein
MIAETHINKKLSFLAAFYIEERSEWAFSDIESLLMKAELVSTFISTMLHNENDN